MITFWVSVAFLLIPPTILLIVGIVKRVSDTPGRPRANTYIVFSLAQLILGVGVVLAYGDFKIRLPEGLVANWREVIAFTVAFLAIVVVARWGRRGFRTDSRVFSPKAQLGAVFILFAIAAGGYSLSIVSENAAAGDPNWAITIYQSIAPTLAAIAGLATAIVAARTARQARRKDDREAQRQEEQSLERYLEILDTLYRKRRISKAELLSRQSEVLDMFRPQEGARSANNKIAPNRRRNE